MCVCVCVCVASRVNCKVIPLECVEGRFLVALKDDFLGALCRERSCEVSSLLRYR